MPKNTGRGSRVGREIPYFLEMKRRGGAFGYRPWWRRLIERYKP